MKYDRQLVDFRALHEGDVFEHPLRADTICKVDYANLRQEEGQEIKIVSYSIVEGALHWPVIYVPPGAEVILLLPTTTTVQMSGKDWLGSLTEHHGVKE